MPPPAGDDFVEGYSVLDQSTPLIDKSLVVMKKARQARHRLLETVRQYALEKLERIRRNRPGAAPGTDPLRNHGGRAERSRLTDYEQRSCRLKPKSIICVPHSPGPWLQR